MPGDRAIRWLAPPWSEVSSALLPAFSPVKRRAVIQLADVEYDLAGTAELQSTFAGRGAERRLVDVDCVQFTAASDGVGALHG